jgi:energy-coupling factor transport system ATP-binding protein
MITIDHLRYRNLAIDTLAIQPGITSVIGPNGSGKTTFLRICAGISLPDSGTVMIDGRLPRETEIGWVNEFPDRNILFVNGFDEIASSLRFRNLTCTHIDSSVRSCAASMGITHLLIRPVREMSGGEKVLVSLAAALVHHPRVLIFDEYDSHLDARSITLIDHILGKWGADYVIRCTQQMDTALRSDHLLFFDSGRILHSGNPQRVIPLLEGTAWFPVFGGC